MNRAERAAIRGNILRILETYGVGEAVAVGVLAKSMAMTGYALLATDLKRACRYLADRGYITMKNLAAMGFESYEVALTADGCDVVEGGKCDASISLG